MTIRPFMIWNLEMGLLEKTLPKITLKNNGKEPYQVLLMPHCSTTLGPRALSLHHSTQDDPADPWTMYTHWRPLGHIKLKGFFPPEIFFTCMTFQHYRSRLFFNVYMKPLPLYLFSLSHNQDYTKDSFCRKNNLILNTSHETYILTPF